MARDIELPQTQGKVNRVEIFERLREKRKVKRSECRRKREGKRCGRTDRPTDHIGRSSNPSFRLPVR